MGGRTLCWSEVDRYPARRTRQADSRGDGSTSWMQYSQAVSQSVCRQSDIQPFHSILKFFQVDSMGMCRMTSSARYFKYGVGSSRPNWRWLICFLELPKAKTSCKAFVKRLRFSCGLSDDTTSSMTSIRHSTCTLARRLPTVYAGRLFLSWRCWSGCRNRL